MDRLAQLATGAGPASRVEADDKEDDDVPDAAPVVIDEIGEVFSWRDFLSFVGEDQDQWTTVALILNACFWFTSTSLGALPLPGACFFALLRWRLVIACPCHSTLSQARP